MIKFKPSKAVLPISFTLFLIVLILLFSTQGKFNKFNYSNPFEKGDYADISTQDANLNVKFSITERDKARTFLNNLDLTNSVFQDISLELDRESLDRISQILPARVKITFDGKKLSFKSPNQIVLKNPSPRYSFKLATQSASLIFNNSDLQNFNLEINNPGVLVSFATESGKLSLSEKLDDLFPILSKISKIELKVYNKAISGEMILK